MHVEVLIAEIGSTTTVVSAFTDLETTPRFLGQGMAPTSVLEGDVRVGLQAAIEDLRTRLGAQDVTWDEILATSSAAGGLKMSVHGLVYDMTVRAAEAAALGAGALVRMATAGRLEETDLDELRALRPNLILLAGGTDHGERQTALFNARQIASLGLDSPVIYAGNVQNQEAIRRLFDGTGVPCHLVENVYPRLDELRIEPTRRVIHAVFEEHIVHAPGMEHLRELVTGHILPTPGAVMEASRLLYEEIGDLVVVDIGGATTDVHSVSQGSEEISRISTAPEPFAKRTVEGDLGLYVNAPNLVDRLGRENLAREMDLDLDDCLARYEPIPRTPEQVRLTERLCREAGILALQRHAGRLRHLFSPQGRQTLAEGKDLTAVRTLVGTGGALTRLPHRELLLRELADCNKTGEMLFPNPGALDLRFDDHYTMAALGVLSKRHPRAALRLMQQSLGLEPTEGRPKCPIPD